MFLRITNRRKDGKDHRYFSVVENRRLPGGKTAQRTVLYLGEINDRQQAAWRKTLEVFDEAEQRFTSMSLFPDDRDLPADAIDSIQVRLSGLELKRPRIFGNCWLACELWRQLGLDEFATTSASGPGNGEVGKGAAVARRQSLARPRQRIPCASAVVYKLRHG